MGYKAKYYFEKCRRQLEVLRLWEAVNFQPCSASSIASPEHALVHSQKSSGLGLHGLPLLVMFARKSPSNETVA